MERIRKHRGGARGMTLVEVLVVLAGSIFLAAIATVVQPAPRTGCGGPTKDSSQVRGVLQALVLFAQNNGGTYPLPSRLDIDNNTVSERGTAKDTSANIYSIMMWNGLVTAQLLVGPRETGNVEQYEGYELALPQAAANPSRALWDPAFPADFTGNEPGGVSYAHMLPGGTRAGRWAPTFKPTEVVVASRGPEVRKVTHKANGSIGAIDADGRSVTYLFRKPYSKWTGSVGYNDNHVMIEQSMSPKGTTYLDAQGKAMADTIFYDEPDDPAGTNAFVSLFITAGDKRSDFTAIWD
jgi:hypothetical protein